MGKEKTCHLCVSMVWSFAFSTQCMDATGALNIGSSGFAYSPCIGIVADCMCIYSAWVQCALFKLALCIGQCCIVATCIDDCIEHYALGNAVFIDHCIDHCALCFERCLGHCIFIYIEM
jgi:hypothetical protein